MDIERSFLINKSSICLGQIYNSYLSFLVEEVRQCWNATSAQVKARLDELEKMMTATEELKAIERELDRWLSSAESDLNNALSSIHDVTERKRIIQVKRLFCI